MPQEATNIFSSEATSIYDLFICYGGGAGFRIPIVAAAGLVNLWDKTFIKSRTRNIGELFWQEISPWIYGN
jgi:hypothetical protein